MLSIQVFTLVILLIIFIEDMRSRAVHWLLFPLLVCSFVALRRFSHHSWHEVLKTTAINFAFIIIQLVLLTVYFSIKQRKLVNITNGLLGWGDLLFLISICFYISLLNFIIFYILSLIVILIGWLIYINLTRIKEQRIPLAGLQSLLLVIFLIISWINPIIKLTNDDQLIYLLSRWM